MNSGIKWGLYLGAVASVMTVVLSYINPVLLFNSWNMIISMILPIVFMVMATKEERSNNGGTLTFGEGVMSSFVTYMVYAIISILFAFVLYNFINPDLLIAQAEYTSEVAVATAEKMAGLFGEEIPSDQLEEMKAKAYEDGSKFTFGTAIIGMLGSAFVGLIISLIIALIMRKNPDA